MLKTKILLKLFGIPVFNFEKEIIDTHQECEENPFTEDVVKEIKDMPEVPTTPSPVGSGQIRPDLKELEKKVLNIEEEPAPIKVTCETCKGVTYDDDIDYCDKCGKQVCSNCGSVDTKVVNKVIEKAIYCEDCWSKL